MKKILMLCLYAALGTLYITLCAQSKFGKTTAEELEMLTYPEDTTASAVILHKDGQLRFVYDDRSGFQFEYTQETKIKILKSDGLQFADNEISYYVADRDSKEEIRSLSGTTYNLEDGKIVKTKLSKENIFEEDSGDKWKKRKITMPNAKVGSVIEYKYTIVSDFYYILRDFYFQTSIPIDYAHFEATIPEYFKYNVNQQGYIKLDKADKKTINDQFNIRYTDQNGRQNQEIVRCTADSYTFMGSKIPAAKNENKLWTINDYISMVSFELKSTYMPGGYLKLHSASWENIDEELLKSSTFGDNLKKSGWFKDLVTQGEPSLERATEIKTMINEKVKWNDKNRAYSSNLKEALNKGIGSSADMNFLLINALNAGGFQAFPVLLSTRWNGRIPVTNPSVTAFNYLITGIKIDTTMYFTDAAAKFSSWNVLPEESMVSKARIVSPNYKGWVDLSTITIGSIFRKADVSFGENSYSVKIKEERGGSDAYNLRRAYSSYTNEEKFIEAVEARNNSTIEDFKLTGIEKNEEKITSEYTETKEIDLESDYIYYTPPISKIYSENPFQKESRTFPVNMDYIQNYVQLIDIQIPQGYEVNELPKSEKFILDNNDLTFTYRIVQQDDLVKLYVQYQVRKLLFLPSEYDNLRDFFAKMILKTDEKIVLKKVE